MWRGSLNMANGLFVARIDFAVDRNRPFEIVHGLSDAQMPAVPCSVETGRLSPSAIEHRIGTHEGKIKTVKGGFHKLPH